MTEQETPIKILVFTEGTILMHKGGEKHNRKEIVQQVKYGEISINNFVSYIPIGDSVNKIEKWKSQGAGIIYLTSRIKANEIDAIANVLENNGYPDGKLVFRLEGESFGDVAERVIPNVLIEDDCESIGGIITMAINQIQPEIKKVISSWVVKEFEGIDHLPDDIRDLMYIEHKCDNKL